MSFPQCFPVDCAEQTVLAEEPPAFEAQAEAGGIRAMRTPKSLTNFLFFKGECDLETFEYTTSLKFGGA